MPGSGEPLGLLPRGNREGESTVQIFRRSERSKNVGAERPAMHHMLSGTLGMGNQILHAFVTCCKIQTKWQKQRQLASNMLLITPLDLTSYLIYLMFKNIFDIRKYQYDFTVQYIRNRISKQLSFRSPMVKNHRFQIKSRNV